MGHLPDHMESCLQVSTDLERLYRDHLETLQRRLGSALEGSGKRAVLIASGSQKSTFLDDHVYPFVVNPHFKAWLPLTEVPDSFVLVAPDSRPVLFYHQAQDYWHKPPADPAGYWVDEWDIQPVGASQDVHNLLGDPAGLAFIGEEAEVADRLGIDTVNPPDLLDTLHFDRAYKTEYEVACMQLANLKAARGHLAAEDAFRQRCSEFEIQHRYLDATGERERQSPYSNIVALNENCAILHYQHYELDPPPAFHSMLIDAGAGYNGYAADVTRTWSFDDDLFAALARRMDAEQQALIGDIQIGMNYATLHENMHRRLAGILKEFDIVDMSTAAMMESNVTFTFLPHGLGHLLGLQTHDVGGLQQDRSGTTRPPPDKYPALRLTRPIEPDQVFTIEPGLYFIPMLLNELRSSPAGRHVNWSLIEELRKYGGIRVEDNVLVRQDRIVNLTRDAFAAASDE